MKCLNGMSKCRNNIVYKEITALPSKNFKVGNISL